MIHGVDIKGYTWSRTTAGRGKRKETVTAGCWLLEHISTGKFIIGSSPQVSQEIDRHIALLNDGKHPNKKLLKLVNMDPDLMAIEIPMASQPKAKKLEREIRVNVNPEYLLLN